MVEFDVALVERSYPIAIGADALQSSQWFSRFVSHETVIVTNTTVAPLHLQTLVNALGEIPYHVITLPDGESFKTVATWQTILDQLLGFEQNRSTTLIALGGGVIGDLTGFAASCFMRGVPFIQVPTTLLAQVDSSVGGKTGVNHPLGKNLIGAFHQPKAVLIDPAVLQTLPAREFACGLAEVIKTAIIFDADFYQWLQGRIDALMNKELDALSYAIERCCRIKASIVQSDEREAGLRAILNFGHTFGHGVEAFMEYQGWLHGEAVSVGMVLAADVSKRLGMITQAQCDQLTALLQRVELPVTLPAGLLPDQFMALMGRDKKVINRRLRLVLLQRIGEAVVTDEVPMELLDAVLHDHAR